MKRWIITGLALGIGIAGLGAGWADTIFFKDGTSIDCIVHEEKQIWKDIEDSNFIEIEVFGGYVGFWDDGQVERIEKNDKYVPPESDTQAYIRKLIEENRLILPSAIVEGGMMLPNQVEKPIQGKIVKVSNFAFVQDVGMVQAVQLEAGLDFRNNQVLSTARNSRLRFSMNDVVQGGLTGGSQLRIDRLNHAEHLSMYQLEMQLEKGDLWLDIRPGVLAGGIQERVDLDIGDCHAVLNQSLLHFRSVPGEQFRLTVLEGKATDVRVRGTPSGALVEPGQTLVIALGTQKTLTKAPADESLKATWEGWDFWQPKQVVISAQSMPAPPISASMLGELSAFREGLSGRESGLALDPLTDSLPIIIKKYRGALDRYKEANGAYPDPQGGGLSVLHRVGASSEDADPYGVRQLPLDDPWGWPIVYELIQPGGESQPLFVSVRSIGPNGTDEKGFGDDIQ